MDCSNIVRVVSVWFPSVFWDAPNVQRHSPKWNSGWGGKVQQFPFGLNMTTVVSVNISTAKAFIRSFFN
jgi:hypothetical protein